MNTVLQSHQTIITSLDLPAKLLMQAWLSRFQVHTAISSPVFTSTPKSSCTGMLSIHSSPVLYSCQGLSQSTGDTPRTLDSALLNLAEVPTGPLTSHQRYQLYLSDWCYLESAEGATSHCLCYNEEIKQYDSLRDTTH